MHPLKSISYMTAGLGQSVQWQLRTAQLGFSSWKSCTWVQLQGSIHPPTKCISGLITHLYYNPSVKHHLVYNAGITPYTCMFFLHRKTHSHFTLRKILKPLNSAGLCPPIPSPRNLISVIRFNPLTPEVHLNTYVYTYIHTFHGSVNISQRQ